MHGASGLLLLSIVAGCSQPSKPSPRSPAQHPPVLRNTAAEPAPAQLPDCVPRGANEVRWTTLRDTATACFSGYEVADTCFSLAPAKPPAPVPPPEGASPSPGARVRDVGGVPSACTPAGCAPLGRSVVAALAERDHAPVGLTRDGRMVVIGKEAWSVSADAPIDLGAARELDVVNGAVLVTDAPCAGPCGLTTLYDSHGRQVGKSFGGGRPLPLDDRRVLILPTEERAEWLVLDVVTGARSRGLPLGRDLERAIHYDATTILTSYTEATGEGWRLQFIAAPPGGRAKLGPSHLVRWCSS